MEVTVALQGTIETFALPDVLRLLATSSKTGKLAVDGDRGLGAIWVADGDIVASEIDLGDHPSTGSTDVTEGLFQILRFESGEFTFTSDDTPASAGDPRNIESSIASSSAMLTELDQITENVPGVQSHVSLRPELSDSEVTLTSEQWKVLAAVGSGSSVASIASNFSFGELDALRRVDDLVGEGVVDVSDQATSIAATAPAATEMDALDAPVEDDLSFAAPAEPEVEVVEASEDAIDPFAPVADEEPAAAADEDPFAAVATENTENTEAVELEESIEAELDDPFAAPETSETSETSETTDVEDPFAAAADDVVDDSVTGETTSHDDPFASTVPEEQIEADDPFAAVATDDPFAPAAEIDAAADDTPAESAGIDPFAPAAATAATGGVLHDVFGNADAETDGDDTWEPGADEVIESAQTEWPAPNVAGEVDADAPWSADDVESQLPPPPAPLNTSDVAADEVTSQLPPPPVLGADEGIDSLSTDTPELDSLAESELPPPPAFDAPEAEVAGVASFPDAPVVPDAPAVSAAESVTSETNDMARQLASLSPAAARAVANAAKAETPEARDAALAEVEAEDTSVDRSLLLRFLGKSDKKAD